MTPDRVYRDIVDADGMRFGDAGGDNESQISAEAQRRFPDPTPESLFNVSKTSVTETVVWAVGLYLEGKYERLPAFEDWAFGLPIKDLLVVLNDLVQQGWSVAHVSEDRGLYAGTTNNTDSSVTTARYLLVRED